MIEHAPLPVSDPEPKVMKMDTPIPASPKPAEPKIVNDPSKLPEDDDWANLPSFFRRK